MNALVRNPDLRAEASAARQLAEVMREHAWPEDDIALSVESETDFAECVTAAVLRLDEMQALADGAKALARQYETRAADLLSRRESLREALAEALERSQVPLPLRLPVGTVSLMTTAPGAVVIDEALVPDQYRRVKVTSSVDLRSVALDLRDGKAVPGTALRNSRRTLQVRR